MGADYICPGCSGRLSVSSVQGVRQYVCQSCGGHVVTVVGLRHLSPEVATSLWSAAEPPAPGQADYRGEPPATGTARCPFCEREMQPRAFPTGSAATCRPCEAVWLDKQAAESVKVTAVPADAPSLGSSTGRCQNCGAVAEDTADGNCKYCGKPLQLPTKVVVLEAPAPAPGPWGQAGAGLVGGVLGGLLDDLLGGPF